MLKIYYLTYCSKCKDLKAAIESEKLPAEFIDADVAMDEVEVIEKLLNTQTYPIVEVKDGTEVIFFVNEAEPTSPNVPGVFSESYYSIPELIIKIKQVLK
jgi:hypothetical protein